MRKLNLCFLLFVFLIGMGSVRAETYQIIGLGDSITTGYGVEEEKSYFYQIATYVSAREKEKLSYYNFAQDGLTSTQLLEQVKTEEMKVQIKSAKYIFMSIGGNDFLQELSSNYQKYLFPSDNYESFDAVQMKLLENVENIIKEIQSVNPTCTIVLVPLYNPYKNILKHNQKVLDKFKVAEKDYTEKVKKMKHVKIDDALGEKLENGTYLNTGDRNQIDPHPNQAGHQLIYESELKLLEGKSDTEKLDKIEMKWFLIGGISFFLVIIVIYKVLKK